MVVLHTLDLMAFELCKKLWLYIFFLLCLALIYPIKQTTAKMNYTAPTAKLARNFEATFQISLRFQDGYHFCSAALIKVTNASNIDVHYGVTAAQCFQHKIRPVYAYMGDVNITSPTGNLQRRLVTRVVNHYDFNPGKRPVDNDMAVLFFDSDFNITQYVKPANFNVNRPPITSEFYRLKVQGWGQMYPEAPDERALQIFETDFIKGSACLDTSKVNTKWTYWDFNKSNMDCYFPPTLIGSGDSGALVIHEDNYGKTWLFGIVSMGHDCFYPDYPGVFTPIYVYAKFIFNASRTP